MTTESQIHIHMDRSTVFFENRASVTGSTARPNICFLHRYRSTLVPWSSKLFSFIVHSHLSWEKLNFGWPNPNQNFKFKSARWNISSVRPKISGHTFQHETSLFGHPYMVVHWAIVHVSMKILWKWSIHLSSALWMPDIIAKITERWSVEKKTEAVSKKLGVFQFGTYS